MDRLSSIARLLLPEVETGLFNDWRWVAMRPLEPWLFGLLLVLTLLGLYASWRGSRRARLRLRVLLIMLRTLAAALVLALLMEPALEFRALSRVRTRVAVLVDRSKSMALVDRDRTRSEAVLAHLEQNKDHYEALTRRAVLEKMFFAEETEPVEHFGDPLPTDGRLTDLSRALREVSWQSSGQNLGAIILYSDGADTQGLTQEIAERQARQLGVPIYAVGFSGGESTKDLAIRRVLVDEFAFVHNPIAIDVELESHGLNLSEVEVSLEQDSEVIKTETARFADGVARVRFQVKPTRIGKQAYKVSVPIQAGEAVDTNNEKSVVLKVIRDRLRVLHVSGRPSWDVRFLRELLKRNPSIDLISFFILRSPTDVQKAEPSEMALIPFPVNELFTPPEINSFDVVIYQNFGFQPHNMQRYLSHVRDYVEKGGSFMMIGGDQSFEEGGYQNTELAEILPLKLGQSGGWEPGRYRPRLTEEAKHPITRIGEPGEPAERPFLRLPELLGFNPTAGLMPDAQALLVHPGLPGNPPLVAVREVGEGRSLAVATDSLWRWRFMSVGEGSTGREYDRFWTTALRWLTRDPELSRVRLDVRHSVVPLGDPIEVEVRVLGEDYRGLSGASVVAELQALPLKADEAPVWSRELKTGASGEVRLSAEDQPAGSYRLTVSARKGEERLGSFSEPVVVEASDLELENPFPRPERLQVLAEASGGAYVDIDQELPKMDLQDPERVEVDHSRQVPMWNRPVALGLLLFLLGASWWLRRRVGLL